MTTIGQISRATQNRVVNSGNNDFAVAEEVTVVGGEHTKRPDVVVYVNGIALGVLELKRSTGIGGIRYPPESG